MSEPFSEPKEYVEHADPLGPRRLRVSQGSADRLYFQASPWGTLLTVKQVDRLVGDLREWVRTKRAALYEKRTARHARLEERALQRIGNGWRLVGYRVRLVSTVTAPTFNPMTFTVEDRAGQSYYAVGAVYEPGQEEIFLDTRKVAPIGRAEAKELRRIGNLASKRDGTETFSYVLVRVYRRKT